MTRTTNSIILFNDIWAADGEKTSAPFDPRVGWDSTFSQAGGNKVSRTLVNGEFNKFSALGYDVNRYGANLFWYSTITYEIGATVLGSNNLRYIAVKQNSNNDPTVDDGTNWTPLKITFANDANVTISEDSSTNTVTIGLVSNLSDKANSDLSNVTIGDFAAKIVDGQYTYKQIDGSKVKINAYEILTDSNITFSPDSLNKQMTFGTSINLSSLRNNFNSGTAPSPTVAGMLWSDTSTKTVYTRNSTNDGWISVNTNADYQNEIQPNTTYNISALDNQRSYILLNYGTGTDNPVTLQLPAHSSVQHDFRMDIIAYDNSDITINAFGGEQFYRNAQLNSTLTLKNQKNVSFSIIKLDSDDNFYVVGVEKNNFINSNTISWDITDNDVIANYQNFIVDQGNSINSGFIINASDNGKTFLVGISSASTINKNISLPSYASVPDNWFVNIEINDIPISQSKSLSINIIPNGSDLLIRNSLEVNQTLQITGASNSSLKILKHPTLTGFVISGCLNFEEIPVIGNTDLTGNIPNSNVFGYNIPSRISKYIFYYTATSNDNFFVKFFSDVNYINNKIITSSSQSSGIYSSIAISNDVTVAGTVELRNDNITIINTCGDDDLCPLLLFVGKEIFI